MTVLRYINIAFIILLFFSCGYSKEDAQKYLPGKYIYIIPSGEFQLLIVDTNFTFKQIVYSDDKQVLYKNSGKMHIKDDEIEFEHWLECYELADPILLPKPYITNAKGPFWRKLENGDVIIVKFDQTNYIFKKART